MVSYPLKKRDVLGSKVLWGVKNQPKNIGKWSAKCSGVLSSLSLASTSAFFSSRSFAISVRPFSAAECSGVHSSLFFALTSMLFSKKAPVIYFFAFNFCNFFFSCCLCDHRKIQLSDSHPCNYCNF